MKTLEQLDAEQASQRARLVAEREIAAALPLVPDAVQMTKTGEAAWASYRKRPMAEALAIFAAFPAIVPFVHAVGTFGHLKPESLISERQPVKVKAGPLAALLTVETGSQFGPSADLSWFARLPDDRIVRVIVGIEGPGYFGTVPQWGANVREERDHRLGRVISRSYGANQGLIGLADGVATFASGDSGPIKSSGSHRYYFVADQDAEMPGADHGHALGQLRNVADMLLPRGED